MSVVYCKEQFGNEGEWDLQGTSYTRKFLVKVSDPNNDRELSIIRSPIVTAKVQILKVWEAGNDINYGVSAMRLRLQQMEDHPDLYELEAEYSSDADDGGGPGGPEENPLDDPPDYEYSWASYKRVVGVGFDETIRTTTQPLGERVRAVGFVNSAFEPFDPQPDIDDDRLILSFSRNEATFNPRVAMAYANTINADPISGADPGQLQMKPFRATLGFRNGVHYWKVRYELHFRWEGWDHLEMDHGSYYWEGGFDPQGVNTKKKFKDEDGHPTTGFLGENGDKLLDSEEIGYFVLKPYPRMNFAPLNLPLPTVPDRKQVQAPPPENL